MCQWRSLFIPVLSEGLWSHHKRETKYIPVLSEALLHSQFTASVLLVIYKMFGDVISYTRTVLYQLVDQCKQEKAS